MLLVIDKGIMDEIIDQPSFNFEEKKENMGEDHRNRNLEPLSPNSQGVIENIQNIVRMKKGKAILERKDGEWKLQYILSNALGVDSSQTNTIGSPERVEGCLELLHFLASQKPANGIVYDRDEISVSYGKLYRNGKEFKSMNKLLGTGISGDVVVVKDKATGREHGLKTVMISINAVNEVRCWIDLNDSGNVPRMFLFQIVNNKIEIHMEIIKGKTLTSIMDEYMFKLRDDQHSHLVKPFSLHVLDRSLDAISAMHDKGWTHNDVHGGNLMLDSDMRVKVIDFGGATKCEENANLNEYQKHTNKILKDYKEALRVFSGLYTNNTFNSVKDFEDNYRNVFEQMDLSDKYELIDLIDRVVKWGDSRKLRSDVKQQLNNVLNDFDQPREQFLMEVAKLMFPERFQAILLSEHVQPMETAEGDEEDEADCIDFEPCCAAPDIDKLAASKLLAEVLGKFGIGQF
ncbi:hypothetical protein DPMN_134522 [Dreissena polymorpha]|uniref:non-specific serine/threonine protein kinase n=1 Tax=Dreissena polymorpha TaxID=45954 RepID=A0A9D4FZ39_DREPO|nr:hypothetical protein DPMN_134522 [Dreissena polymorpha]